MRKALALGLSFALLAVSALAADPPQPSADITVTALPHRKATELVERFSAPLIGERFARWREPICIYFRGMDVAYSQFIVERMGQLALNARIPFGTKGFDPNVVIIVSANSSATRQAIAKHANAILKASSRWPISTSQLAAFLQDDGAPIHVFHTVADLNASTGRSLTEMTTEAPASVIMSGVLPHGNYATIRGEDSRLIPVVEPGFQRVVAVVDGFKFKGLTVSQMAA